MYQSFKAVNLDKREFVCPWCIHQGAALSQWAVGPHSGIMALLICKDADESASYVITATDRPVIIAEVSHKSIFKDESPTPSPASSVIGRWAGDRVCMIDDDDLNLRDEFANYTNITEQLVRGWNDYICGGNAQLEFTYCGCSSFNSDLAVHS